jgi:excisionase family DNA binding protein
VQTDKKWLTIREAATYIGMSVGFLRKAVRLRRVPYTRIGNKSLRFDRNALDQWLATQSDGENFLLEKTVKAVEWLNTQRP